MKKHKEEDQERIKLFQEHIKEIAEPKPPTPKELKQQLENFKENYRKL